MTHLFDVFDQDWPRPISDLLPHAYHEWDWDWDADCWHKFRSSTTTTISNLTTLLDSRRQIKIPMRTYLDVENAHNDDDHPDTQGHAAWAAYLWEYIEDHHILEKP